MKSKSERGRRGGAITIGLLVITPCLLVVEGCRPTVYTRPTLAKTLGDVEGSTTVEPLTALKDDNARVRTRAAEALGQIKDTRAIEPLIAALKDENADVRREAAEALGRMKDTRAIEPLMAALEDLSVQSEAARALKRLGVSQKTISVKEQRVQEEVAAHARRNEKDYTRLRSEYSSFSSSGGPSYGSSSGGPGIIAQPCPSPFGCTPRPGCVDCAPVPNPNPSDILRSLPGGIGSPGFRLPGGFGVPGGIGGPGGFR